MKKEDIDNIPKLSEILNGEDVEGYCYECYDGDTFKCIVTIFDKHKVRITCRLYGIDTPEKRTRDKNEKKWHYFLDKLYVIKFLIKILK